MKFIRLPTELTTMERRRLEKMSAACCCCSSAYPDFLPGLSDSLILIQCFFPTVFLFHKVGVLLYVGVSLISSAFLPFWRSLISQLLEGIINGFDREFLAPRRDPAH